MTKFTINRTVFNVFHSLLMAFALGAAEAAELAEASSAAALRGAFSFGSSSASSYVPFLGAGLTGAAGLGGILYGAYQQHMAGRRTRTPRSTPRRNVRRRLFSPRSTPRRMPNANPRTGGFLGLEKKFIDSSLSNTDLSSSWAVYDPTGDSLAPIAEGDGENSRDGRRAIVKELFIHGQIRWASTSGTDNEYGPIRIVVVQDRQTNGAAPTASDVFETPSGVQAINAFRNLQYTSRFKILGDIILPAPCFEAEGNGTTASITGRYVPFKLYVPILNMNVTYNGTNSTISNVVDNSVHMLAVYGGDFASPQIQYAARARFMG